MLYFIDFDRTLLDTDRFSAWLLSHPACEGFAARIEGFPIGAPERQEVWLEIWEMAKRGDITITAEDVAKHVYPDVPAFFRAHGDEIVIVTFGHPAWQQFKVELALPFRFRDAIYNDGKEWKIESIAAYRGADTSPAAFVDDHAAQLAAAAASGTALSLFEMRRDGASGDGRWPVIRSFSEVP